MGTVCRCSPTSLPHHPPPLCRPYIAVALVEQAALSAPAVVRCAATPGTVRGAGVYLDLVPAAAFRTIGFLLDFPFHVVSPGYTRAPGVRLEPRACCLAVTLWTNITLVRRRRWGARWWRRLLAELIWGRRIDGLTNIPPSSTYCPCRAPWSRSWSCGRRAAADDVAAAAALPAQRQRAGGSEGGGAHSAGWMRRWERSPRLSSCVCCCCCGCCCARSL